MLLDSASLYFRAFYGVPDTVRAPDGTPVNAVRGLLDMISRLVRARHPARLVACWDADWRPAFRVAAVPSYKAHRLAADGGEDVPAALAQQVPLIEDVLHAAGLPIVASDIDAFRQVLRGGQAGELFATGDAQDLARAAGRLLDDAALRKRLSAAALTAVADYDWSVVAREVFSVYETVVLGSTQAAVTAPGNGFP